LIHRGRSQRIGTGPTGSDHGQPLHQLTGFYLTVDCRSAGCGGERTFAISDLAGVYKDRTVGEVLRLMRCSRGCRGRVLAASHGIVLFQFSPLAGLPVRVPAEPPRPASLPFLWRCARGQLDGSSEHQELVESEVSRQGDQCGQTRLNVGIYPDLRRSRAWSRAASAVSAVSAFVPWGPVRREG
jgi:hypothetical protein